VADGDDQPRRNSRARGRVWPKLALSGVVGITVAGGIALKLLT
jgi:hypothetical protein